LPRIIIAVTNDLSTDQRIKKICETLHELNFDIVLIGRELRDSLPLHRNYKTIRFKLLFNKGFLFYTEYNARLFFHLLFLKKDVLLANDLDTLLPIFLISKLFSKKLVYDSHELFTEVPELVNRTTVQKVWLAIENYIFPRLKNIYSVNDSIATYYSKKYNVTVSVIRNISVKLKNPILDTKFSKKTKGNKKMIILQGSGINIDRGTEEAVAMMQFVENTILYIIGGGDVFKKLKKLIEKYGLNEKIFLKGKLPYDELLEYTKIADLGLSLDKSTNLNYEYALPNKIFDYIQCNIPILASNRKEVSELINKNNIGFVTDTHNPKKLADIVNSIFRNRELYQSYKTNLAIAAEKYTWENESKKLIEIYTNLK
jgi:glycosyltransferase involved in cell wall biosynthesis